MREDPLDDTLPADSKFEFQLGDAVLFKNPLSRRQRPAAPHPKKVWEPNPWEPERVGIVVGTRTLYDGHVEFGYYDEPTIFAPESSFQAYLIAWHPRRKLVLVRIGDVRRIRALVEAGKADRPPGRYGIITR